MLEETNLGYLGGIYYYLVIRCCITLEVATLTVHGGCTITITKDNTS